MNIADPYIVPRFPSRPSPLAIVMLRREPRQHELLLLPLEAQLLPPRPPKKKIATTTTTVDAGASHLHLTCARESGV